MKKSALLSLFVVMTGLSLLARADGDPNHLDLGERMIVVADLTTSLVTLSKTAPAKLKDIKDGTFQMSMERCGIARKFFAEIIKGKGEMKEGKLVKGDYTPEKIEKAAVELQEGLIRDYGVALQGVSDKFQSIQEELKNQMGMGEQRDFKKFLSLLVELDDLKKAAHQKFIQMN
jgi:hypothetical protein